MPLIASFFTAAFLAVATAASAGSATPSCSYADAASTGTANGVITVSNFPSQPQVRLLIIDIATGAVEAEAWLGFRDTNTWVVDVPIVGQTLFQFTKFHSGQVIAECTSS